MGDGNVGDIMRMLVIFDLDDTLIDTSGTLRRPALFDALLAMINAGLSCNNQQVHILFERLLELDLKLESGMHALSALVCECESDVSRRESLLELGRKAYLETGLKLEVCALPLAGEVLRELSFSHPLVLVSAGDRDAQFAKLKRSGLSQSFFSKICITAPNFKKEVYAKLLREFNILPEQVLVCGDRYEQDLRPAQELGMRTVQVQWGKGKIDMEGRMRADYSIAGLQELISIVGKRVVGS